MNKQEQAMLNASPACMILAAGFLLLVTILAPRLRHPEIARAAQIWMPLEAFTLLAALTTTCPGILGNGSLARGIEAVAAVFRALVTAGRTSLSAAWPKTLRVSRRSYAQKSCQCCQHDDETHRNPPLEAFDGVDHSPCCYRPNRSPAIMTDGPTEMKMLQSPC